MKSNNYPGHYPNNMDCFWVMTAEPNEHIQLTFEDFNLEKNNNCKYDYVSVSIYQDITN